MTELKSCPFCGGKAQLRHGWDRCEVSYGFDVYCFCGATMEGQEGAFTSEADAIAAWNCRADDPLKERMYEILKSIMPEECYAGEARTAADCDGCELRDDCDRYVALKVLAEWGNGGGKAGD